jgi:hypothetical protein
MSYDSTRISEQLRVLEPDINKFIVRYNASTGPVAGIPRQTVFILPGGMASRLVRAKAAFDFATPAKQVFAYDELWLNVLTFLQGRARDLRMTRVAPGDYRDKADRIIVADGLINLLGVTPYVGFTQYCELMKLDYFVFPWDWRRSVPDIAELFIEHFLPHFQDLVKAGCNNADPLLKFSVIGHSAGGMIANWALRSSAPIMKGLQKAITVATPFYGYGGQLHRWFEGEKFLNGVFNIYKKDIIRAICSFPGCYAFQFLPYPLYQFVQAELAADGAYPLLAYPSRDFATGAVADPYDPQTNGANGRYPASGASGFDPVELAAAEMVVTFLASPMTPLQADRFWNIRADTAAGNTLNTTTWKWVPPADPCPIDNLSVTAGDGVQPAWTTRHVDLAAMPLPHVITVKSSLAAHTTIMSEPNTILTIAAILAI